MKHIQPPLSDSKVVAVTGLESEVRSYCRSFPATFARAAGSILETDGGERYLDFLAGCGALNYGHNNPLLRHRLTRYLEDDGISMSLDMETVSKAAFMDLFRLRIMIPRNLDYKLQFPGPTGANAVEAAVKLARKVTGRTNVIAFTNAFHGCTQGALSLTANAHHRSSSSALLNQVTRLPYDGSLGAEVDTADILEKLLADGSSGVDTPAAIILETVQGEGGLNRASAAWLRRIRRIASDHGVLLIVDDIQAGCGRLGTFFSFEHAGLQPDIVVLSKSLSGFGQPLAMLMIAPQWDAWKPGEHNGTFRGNNLAFVTAAATLEAYWSDALFALEVVRKAGLVTHALDAMAAEYGGMRKGAGMMQGLDVGDGERAAQIRELCFHNRLILETCGPDETVVKLLPPLTIDDGDLSHGLAVLKRCVAATCAGPARLASIH